MIANKVDGRKEAIL